MRAHTSFLALLVGGALAAPTIDSLDSSLDTRSTAKTLISKALYSNLTQYAGFAQASASQPCKNPPYGATVVQEINIGSTDTQASVYKLSSTKELIVAFPGTAIFSIDDYWTDGDLKLVAFPELFPRCSTCQLHEGFGKAFKSIVPTLNGTLHKAIVANPGYSIVMVGYSLGGALAKLAFAYYKDNHEFGPKVTVGYSYGEPRNSDPAFANYVDNLSGTTGGMAGMFYRVTHQNDSIPQSPQVSSGFRHSSTEYWEMNGESSGVPSASTTYRCYGQEPADCNNSQMGNLNDHGAYPGLNGFDACS